MSADDIRVALAGLDGAAAVVLAWLIVFISNAVTFPLPPAWMVLAAFRTSTDAPLLPLTIGGSAAAAFGRFLFALQVGRFTERLPADARVNAQALSTAAHSHMRWPWLFVVVYSFLPIPSDAVFIAVGLGALPIRSSLLAFFLARSVYNTFMVILAGPLVSNLTDLFAGRPDWRSLVIVVLATGGYALLLKLPWARWLHVQATAPAG